MRKLLALIGVVSVAWLSACSTTADYKGVYADVSSRQPLDVPPGLDSPQEKSEQLPEMDPGAKSYSEFASQGRDNRNQTYLQTYKNIRFVREGSFYWLEVKDYPENVWPDIRAFYTRLGFKIITEQPQLGIMQTDWKENRVGIPTGWIASMLGKLYESELVDSYRIRMEFDEDKAISRIFIAHRGMREVVEGEQTVFIDSAGVKTKWIPRDSDPELEIEMLMRFMAYRGMDEKLAKETIASTKIEQRTELLKQDDIHVLKVTEIFARTWRHVGIALDRMGVAIEDRNRSAGIYYIKLPETFEIPDSGFFSSSKKPSSYDYLLSVVDKGDTTEVLVKARGEVGQDLPIVTKKILTDIQSNIL